MSDSNELSVKNAKGNSLLQKSNIHNHNHLSILFAPIIEALSELIKAINEDTKLKQLKENCANDMLKYIQTFIPLIMEIQFKFISKYGFSPDNQGKLAFRFA